MAGLLSAQTHSSESCIGGINCNFTLRWSQLSIPKIAKFRVNENRTIFLKSFPYKRVFTKSSFEYFISSKFGEENE
jgi:hypothetical protein